VEKKMLPCILKVFPFATHDTNDHMLYTTSGRRYHCHETDQRTSCFAFLFLFPFLNAIFHENPRNDYLALGQYSSSSYSAFFSIVLFNILFLLHSYFTRYLHLLSALLCISILITTTTDPSSSSLCSTRPLSSLEANLPSTFRSRLLAVPPICYLNPILTTNGLYCTVFDI